MRISQAAAAVGVASHVLRHWEEEGVLVPDRVGSHREFSDQHVEEARIVHRLRRAGMGLAEVRQLRGAPALERAAVVEAVAERLRADADRALSAESFLRHTLECRHPLVRDCASCAG